ncbi:MAG: hypothetical protein R2941_21895 [Desulfobacterales bacterium]
MFILQNGEYNYIIPFIVIFYEVPRRTQKTHVLKKPIEDITVKDMDPDTVERVPGLRIGNVFTTKDLPEFNRETYREIKQYFRELANGSGSDLQ